MYFVSVFWILFCIVSSAQSRQSNETVSYEGAQVWRTPLRDEQYQLIQQLADDGEDISLWRLDTENAEYLVREESQVKVKQFLESHQLNHSVTILNVQRRIEETTADEHDALSGHTLRNGPRMNWKTYPTLQIIDEYILFLANNFPSICKVKIVGKSVENRPIMMLSVSDGSHANKAVLITGGLHAREWVAITSVFYIINDIVTRFHKQPPYVKNKDWHFIPLVNPDGFVYTHKGDRLWRKNRRKTGACYGVDINRNFDIHFAAGPKSEECSSTYAGVHPFSEPETVTIRDTIQKLRRRPSAYIDIHSYGQHVLHPWSSHTSKHNYNLNALKATAAGISRAIWNSTKQTYGSGSAPDLLYPAPGPAIDWVYSTGTPLSFALEARDTGIHGFLLPKSHIEPTGKDMLSAAKYVAMVL